MKSTEDIIDEIEAMVFGRRPRTISFDACQDFLARVVASDEFRKQFPRKKLKKTSLHPTPSGVDYSCGENATIWLHPQHHCRHLILHELAHAITQRNRTPFHGRSFRKRYVFLAETFLAKKHAEALKNAFKEAFGD